MSDIFTIVDPALVATPQMLRAAYDRMVPKFLLVPREQAMRVNVDAQHAFSTGLVVAGRLPAFQADFERLAFYLHHDSVHDFMDRTLAFGFSNSEYNIAMTPASDIAKKHEEAAKLVDVLLVSASALSVQGLLPNERVERIRSSVGYNDAAEQLMALTKMFQDHWAVISNKTGITEAQVDSAAVLSVELSHAAGLRNHTKLSPSEATVQRERAFTLFYQSYSEVRRVVEFVRARQGDAELIVPTLFPRKPRSRAEEDADATPAPVVPAESGETPLITPPASVPVGHRRATVFEPS